MRNNMVKWADYLISAVQYDPEHPHINKVKGYEDREGNKVGDPFESSRKEVIENIKNNKTYITIFKGEDKKWHEGKVVHIIVVGETEYIRTDQNQEGYDNLENLPKF